MQARKKTAARWSARAWLLLVALAGVPLGLLLTVPDPALAQEGSDEPATRVGTEAELRAAWADLTETHIELTDDIFLHQCKTGDPIRESPYPMLLDGQGHTIRQTCFEKRVLRQDGTGYLLLKNVKLTRGGSDGPGAAITTRGEIKVVDSKVQQNLAEEPGGGIFSMRRATIIRSVITNNLANDDGGGALYADEDGDVTVVDSTVNGSDADGPGGGIWTLDGDVTVVGSTLNGNRADDRGGAIGGEADVFVINSTVARNAAVAHVAGGIFSRGNLYIANSTVSNNYAEGQGGGILGGGMVRLEHSSILNNTAPVAANVGAGEGLESYASVIGPARITDLGGQVQPTERNCHLGGGSGSFGYNLATDASCGLDGPEDIVDEDDPLLGPFGDNGGFGETLLPESGSPVVDRMPTDACDLAPFEGFLKEGDQHLEGLIDDRPALMLKDQRGVDRPQGPACDVGAVELGP